MPDRGTAPTGFKPVAANPSTMIPLVHDLGGTTVLVLGGGPVGARKARRFAAEARVVVVSPTFADADFGDVERIRAAPTAGDVAGWLERVGPSLLVAATDDPTVNAAAESAAIDAGVLVNRADASGPRRAGSVVLPAIARRGPALVAVSSEGTDPVLSRGLKSRIAPALDAVPAVAAALDSVRSALPADEQLDAARAVATAGAVWDAAAAGDPDLDVIAMAVAEAAIESDG